MDETLDRFLVAQQNYYQTAYKEIQGGRKRSHWMWFIFPQIIGLGGSETARYYAIRNLEEAKAYLADDTLGSNLLEISKALLDIDSDDAVKIFGYPDVLKLQSSMTLFSLADPEQEVFFQVLDKYYHGERDENTIRILQEQETETRN